MKFKLSILLMLFVTVSYSQKRVAKVKPGTIERIGNQRDKINSATYDREYLINWIGIRNSSIGEESKVVYLTFEGAIHNFPKGALPRFELKTKLYGNPNSVLAELVNPVYKELTGKEANVISEEFLLESVNPTVTIVYHKKEAYAVCSFIPLRKNQTTGKIEKMVAFDLDWIISSEKGNGVAPTTQAYVDNSVLNSGEWYKVAVVEDGIHRLTYAKLKTMGLDPDDIDPRNIRIYGNGAGMLPMQNAAFRYDDLQENSILVQGESDGVFNASDYVLFYGQSQELWGNNGIEFTHEKNLFCDTTFYFITASLGVGKRINNQPSLGSYTETVTSFNERIVHEKDRTNLIKTGQEWYGEQFGIVNTYHFSFQIPNIDVSESAKVEIDFASHSPNISSEFIVNANNVTVSKFDDWVTPGYTNIYADKTNFEMELVTPGSSINIEINFNKGNASALAWLNYIEINARRLLKMNGNQMHFRDLASVGSGNIARFQISNAGSEHSVWNITDPINPAFQVATLTGNVISYNADASSIEEYIVYGGNYFIDPIVVGEVLTQDLHAMKDAHPKYIIVTHPKFKNQAEELAQFHRDQEGFSAVVVTTNEVYNEFSSGAQDINAIRGFVKMFYDEATTVAELPKYLLLFGDGSYDYKDRVSGNSNYVPVYQSKSSFNPTTSYCSDDFYGLLDDLEGESSNQYIDLGIGRLPVRTVQQAIDQVNKVKRYYSEETMRPWRNWLLFIGDDEDGYEHMDKVNKLAIRAAEVNGNVNIDKIYLDAYPQVSGAGGDRYPEVVEAFNKRMEHGALIVSYMGHGGELGWTKERILEVPQINAWTNEHTMPLFLTATCEFSRYDDPQRTAAGEYVLLNPRGGAIALLTTTRLVYSGGNYSLMDNFFEFGFSQLDSGLTTLGDLVEATKINTASDENSRKFNLLGDPALTLAIPKYNVVTTEVPDTMKGLSKVTIRGYVADKNNQKMEDFNGVIYPSVFDKSREVKGLHNDNPTDTNDFTFNLQTAVIFKGRASVTNGDFEFTFVVPKDISLAYGNARISYYAENDLIDAAGNETDFLLGGYDPNAAEDSEAPEVDLYMNDETFVFGGLTDENPTMLAYIFDDNGINTSGNGIGHDLVAILDENTTNSIVLNDYYEAELDDYQKGTINYPFNKLDEGQHTLTLKVWDVYNNSAEANTEFVVAESAELALDHVLNYHNPFTTSTAFYFEHNQPGQGLDVRIEIFTVSGKLIKTLSTFIVENSYRVGPIYWDGLDEYGDLIGKGVYIYKLKVAVPTGESVDYFEKLVILN
ncbi:MAG: type IX secretion system sortase PorU [Flavobacteriales bacterium]|nr:type IX secretion system sortase PorU [Flavobacteriales bacterium]